VKKSKAKAKGDVDDDDEKQSYATKGDGYYKAFWKALITSEDDPSAGPTVMQFVTALQTLPSMNEVEFPSTTKKQWATATRGDVLLGVPRRRRRREKREGRRRKRRGLEGVWK
jgi:hypothetical protein